MLDVAQAFAQPHGPATPWPPQRCLGGQSLAEYPRLALTLVPQIPVPREGPDSSLEVL